HIPVEFRFHPPPPLVTKNCTTRDPALRSGFRLRSPAPHTPANRLKFESNRRHHSSHQILRCARLHATSWMEEILRCAQDFGTRLRRRVNASSSSPTAATRFTLCPGEPCAHVIASAVRLPHDCALLVWRGRELCLRPESPAQLLGSFARARPPRC